MAEKGEVSNSMVEIMPRKRRRVITDILIVTCSLVTISGFVILYLKLTVGKSLFGTNLWWWGFMHRITALLTLIFTIPHIIKNRKWYKGMTKNISKKIDSNSFQLSIWFSLTIISVIILAFKRDVIFYEYIHSIIGIITVYLLYIHTIKKYRK